MKNDTKMMKLVAVVLLLTMVALILVSGTYAKYTSTASGTATATVAKFSVGSNLSSSFALFSTVKEADANATEEDVASGKIAPGTGGQFAISLTNDSEVTVEYTLSLTETSNTSNIPIEYSLDGTTYVTADKLSKETGATGTLAIGSTQSTSSTVTVYWRWAFTGAESTNYTSQTDSDDTVLGTAETAPTITVQASVIFDQVD